MTTTDFLRPSRWLFWLCVALAVALPVLAAQFEFTREHHLALSVSSPNVVTVTTTPQTVFTQNLALTDGRVLVRTLQNTGTTPVLYAIGATVTGTAYHGILAGGSVAKDGLGTVLDLSRVRGTVSLMTESGTSTVAVVELTQ